MSQLFKMMLLVAAPPIGRFGHKLVHVLKLSCSLCVSSFIKFEYCIEQIQSQTVKMGDARSFNWLMSSHPFNKSLFSQFCHKDLGMMHDQFNENQTNVLGGENSK